MSIFVSYLLIVTNPIAVLMQIDSIVKRMTDRPKLLFTENLQQPFRMLSRSGGHFRGEAQRTCDISCVLPAEL